MKRMKRLLSLGLSLALLLTTGLGVAYVGAQGGDGTVCLLEAEDGALTSGTSGSPGAVCDNPKASGGKMVQYLGDRCGVEFDVSHPAANRLVVRYTTEQPGSYEVFIDDQSVGLISFASTGSWTDNFEERYLDVFVPENAKIRLEAVPGGTANMDCIRLEKTEITQEPVAFAEKMEAESGTFLPFEGHNGQAVPDGTASGGYLVGYLSDGAKVEYTVPHQAATQLSLTYCSDQSGTLKVYIDDVYAGDLSFTSTGGWSASYSTVSLQAEIPENAKITLESVPGGAANLDYLILSTDRLEAEDAAQIEGSSGFVGKPNADGAASGGYTIAYFEYGAQMEFAAKHPAANRLTAVYASDQTGVLKVYVDDVYAGNLEFTPSGGWAGTFAECSLNTYIPEDAKITLEAVAGGAANVDYIRLSNFYTEAEPENTVFAKNTSLTGATLEKDMASVSGTAVGLSADGASLTWAVPSGTAANAFTLRYKAEGGAEVTLGDRTASLPDTGLTGNYATYTIALEEDMAGRQMTLTLRGTGILWVDSIQMSHVDIASSPAVEVDRLPQGKERLEVSLNGRWDITATGYDQDILPELYDNTIQVPGLWDMAEKDLGAYEGKALWYRKTVTLPAVPNQATLEIKGNYGKWIYVNGQLVEEHQFNFTMAYVDITPYLKAGANEIVVKIGSYDSQIGQGVHQGYDQEKHAYYPGITDAVTLVLSGNAVVTRLQTAPDLDKGALWAEAVVENRSAGTLTTDVIFQILDREGTLVGQAAETGVVLKAGEDRTVTAGDILIDGIGRDKWWTPDNPYLYTVRVITSGDTYETRVGMRTFCYDPETKLPMLNGEVYYLRGTNICMGRFYEDASRGDHPWDEDWARALLQQFKEVNWEVARSAVGFLPEMWYDLCDEMGFMIMDEYPYWQLGGDGADPDNCSVDTLAEEAVAWIYERGNHACVIAWDMQNESPNSEKTSEVIRRVRSLDPQNRPWDNGWGADHSTETDSLESHVYFNGSINNYHFNLGQLNQQSNQQASTYTDNTLPNPVILNEYCWLWLDREGYPTTLTTECWDYLLPGATPEERQVYYADWLAAETEFWREGRFYAGVLQFCGLGYSNSQRKGETSDLLMPDLTVPRFQPYMAERLKSAFAPVGIVIHNYTERVTPGMSMTLPVALLNDESEDVILTVELVLTRDGEEISRQSKEYIVPAAGKVTKEFTVTVPDEEGNYQVTARYTRDGETVSSIRKWTCAAEDRGIATGKPVTASSDFTWQGVRYLPEYANDADSTTRWASNHGYAPQWITVDLEAVYDITKVRLNWETAYASGYQIQVSDDNVHFTTVYTGGASSAGEQVVELTGRGRYIRMLATDFGTQWGCSLYDFEIWGIPYAVSGQPEADALTARIKDLPDTVTRENQAEIQAVIDDYDAATDEVKSLIPEQAKEKLETLRKALEEFGKPSQPTASTDPSMPGESTSGTTTTVQPAEPGPVTGRTAWPAAALLLALGAGATVAAGVRKRRKAG